MQWYPSRMAKVSHQDHGIDAVLLKPGHSVSFADRDQLLETLDPLDRCVPARHEERARNHREHCCMLRYLRFVAGDGLLSFPATLRKPPQGQDPPDFILEGPGMQRETFELTDGSTREYRRRLARASRDKDRLALPVGINTPEQEAAELWAEILLSAFHEKASALQRGRFSLDHLLIYDLTGLGLLVPLEQGGRILRRRLQDWDSGKEHRFRRVSILRDRALLLDLENEGRILRQGSPSFQIPVIQAQDEEDLKRRLREIDRFCRRSSIRHLKAFGSILGDRIKDFREDSDLDLLVEFEPGTRVTLFDMARMERELGDLTGFKVDLRTEGDLSRYFRSEVLRNAVELRAAQG